MFGRFFQVFVGWWNEYQKENQFVHDTLEELHQKLGVFDQGGDYWTYRGKTYVSVCKGKKFPLYLHWKTAALTNRIILLIIWMQLCPVLESITVYNPPTKGHVGGLFVAPKCGF